MSKILIGAGIAAIVALGYAFFRYEHRCPTPGEIDQIVTAIKGNRLSPTDAEVIARELDRRKCSMQADRVRAASREVNAGAAAAAKAAADAKAAAEAAKPKCPAIFLKLPDAPLRRASTPTGPAFGITSIRSFAVGSMALDPVVRESHAKILEDEADYWKETVPASVFADAAKCLRGLVDPTMSIMAAPGYSSSSVLGFGDPRRRFFRAAAR